MNSLWYSYILYVTCKLVSCSCSWGYIVVSINVYTYATLINICKGDEDIKTSKLKYIQSPTLHFNDIILIIADIYKLLQSANR